MEYVYAGLMFCLLIVLMFIGVVAIFIAWRVHVLANRGFHFHINSPSFLEGGEYYDR